MDRKHFKVAGLGFNVEIEEPWKFASYSEPVAERIESLSKGGPADVTPTLGGEKIPPRTLVRSKDELPEGMDRYSLDFSQYEPFASEGEDGFTLKVCASEPDWLRRARGPGYKPGTASGMRLMMSVDDYPPEFYIYDRNGDTVFEFSDKGKVTSTMLFARTKDHAEVYLPDGTRPYGAVFEIGMSLMTVYAYCSVFSGRMLFHSSVIERGGKAYMFMGKSGTGKSTHARLWLENIVGCTLLNDDNPVVMVRKGSVEVFGSPWSGKTPCYRNVSFPVGGIVRLSQAQSDSIRRVSGLEAFASVLGGVAAFRWDRDFMDKLNSLVEQIVLISPCWRLDCLPDRNAAVICSGNIC